MNEPNPSHGILSGNDENSDAAEAVQAAVPARLPADVRPTFPGRRERTRARLARLTGWSTESYSPILEPLLRIVRANNPKEDFDLIQRAFSVAENTMRGKNARAVTPTSPTPWRSPPSWPNLA